MYCEYQEQIFIKFVVILRVDSFVSSFIWSALLRPAMSVNIECEFKTGNYFFTLHQVYTCAIRSVNNYEDEFVTITGNHVNNKTNDDVIGIYGSNFGSLQTFPKGLEKVFKNLKAIYTTVGGQLRELHQEDLKPFPNLVEFLIDGNQIEIIEEGLFDFNPHLEAISFYYNKIFHVNYNVFDNLSRLSNLWMNGCQCYSDVSRNRESTLALIQRLKVACQNPVIVRFEGKLEDLKERSNNPSQAKAFKILIESYQSDFMNIHDPRLLYLKRDYLRLKESNRNEINMTTISEPSTNINQDNSCISNDDILSLNKRFESLETQVESKFESLNDQIKTLEMLLVKSKSEEPHLKSNNNTLATLEINQLFEKSLENLSVQIIRKIEAIESEYRNLNKEMSARHEEKLHKIEEQLAEVNKEIILKEFENQIACKT